MTEVRREIGVIGLGRMGGGLAQQAARKGMHVVGYDPLGHHPDLQQAGVVPIRALAEFVDALAPPRAIFLYIPAGPDVDVLLDQLAKLLSRGDVIIDGGNSYWGDSIHRAKRLAALGIELVDAGTSGGIEGARHGACFMVGGSPTGVARVEPLLKELAIAGGYVHAGPSGAGHFTKLVHNGIEFGMLQAIGEGVDLLEHYRDHLDVAGVLACWRNGSVIRGWLIDLMHQQYSTAGGLDHIPPFVEDTGEVNWLVADALRMEIAIPVIAQAVMELFASRDNQKNWARAIAMMRNGFGGHPFGPNAHVADERKHGQVDGTFRDE